MKVAIFETTHFEGAYPVIRLFDNGINKITIFTYEESFRQFQFLFGKEMEKYNWVVKKDNESKYQFIVKMYQQVRALHIDLFYLNTIADNYIFYAWMISRLKPIRVVTTFHSINNYFEHKPSLSLRRLVRILGKKKLVRVVNEFNVVSLTMVDYLKQRLPPSKKIHCIPGAVYDPQNHPPEVHASPGLHVVVPGSVDERRRNYEMVMELVELINHAGVDITVTLLGGIHPEFGTKILQQLREKEWYGRLKYFEKDVVDQPEFDRIMEECDIVLLPSTLYIKIFDAITEQYGLSMSSGNLFDIIKHAKPFLTPFGLRVDPYLESSCLRYQNAREMMEILIALQASPDVFASLKEKARLASQNYTIEAVRRRNPDLFP